MLYKVALKFEFVGAILVLLCNKGKLLSSNLLWSCSFCIPLAKCHLGTLKNSYAVKQFRVWLSRLNNKCPFPKSLCSSSLIILNKQDWVHSSLFTEKYLWLRFKLRSSRFLSAQVARERMGLAMLLFSPHVSRPSHTFRKETIPNFDRKQLPTFLQSHFQYHLRRLAELYSRRKRKG